MFLPVYNASLIQHLEKNGKGKESGGVKKIGIRHDQEIVKEYEGKL